MKYKIFYTFKGGSDNSKNNSIENVEDIVRKTNLEEEQNPIDKVSTSSEIPLTDKEQVKRQKEKDKKKRRKERKKAEKAQENTPSVSSTSTSTTSSENNSNNEGKDVSTSTTSSEIPLTKEQKEKERQKAKKRRQRERKEAENKPSVSSTSNDLNPFDLFLNQKSSPKLDDDLTEDILIIGEDHVENHDESLRLQKEFYNKKNFFIFGEGFLPDDRTDNLDDPNESLRAGIYLTSSHTKLYEIIKQAENSEEQLEQLLKNQQDLLHKMLQNQKPLPIEKLITPNEKLINTWQKINDKKIKITEELIKSFIPEINAIIFDFWGIYEYYFGTDDPYYTDMFILLNITENETFWLNNSGAEHPTYGKYFKKVMSEAREKKMVERVIEYMDKPNRLPKVVLFTGKKHVNNLQRELSKKYTVKIWNL